MARERALAHTSAQFVGVGVDHAIGVQLNEAEQIEEAFADLLTIVPAVGLGGIPRLIPHL